MSGGPGVDGAGDAFGGVDGVFSVANGIDVEKDGVTADGFAGFASGGEGVAGVAGGGVGVGSASILMEYFLVNSSGVAESASWRRKRSSREMPPITSATICSAKRAAARQQV
ncbi:hypothetical protein AGMMS50233_10510 [Endomicrobiia bacterium]|nr:hypothetical protein AGMMS50233_10510 [Endomicrobiia bacterium]